MPKGVKGFQKGHKVSNKKKKKKVKGDTPFPRSKAIRNFCIECFCYQPKLTRSCTDNSCPLFPYRMGKKNKTGYIKKTPKQRSKG